jgi:hypothetical protein
MKRFELLVGVHRPIARIVIPAYSRAHAGAIWRDLDHWLVIHSVEECNDGSATFQLIDYA